jgi:hypothetical protein
MSKYSCTTVWFPLVTSHHALCHCIGLHRVHAAVWDALLPHRRAALPADLSGAAMCGPLRRLVQILNVVVLLCSATRVWLVSDHSHRRSLLWYGHSYNDWHVTEGRVSCQWIDKRAATGRVNRWITIILLLLLLLGCLRTSNYIFIITINVPSWGH